MMNKSRIMKTFWALACIAPLAIFALSFLSPALTSFDFLAFMTANFAFFDLGIFASLSSLGIPLGGNLAIFDCYVGYLCALSLLRIVVEFVTFLPRCISKFMEKF